MATPTTRRSLLALALVALGGCTKLYDTASLDPLGDVGGFCRARYDAHYQLAVRCWGWDPAYALVRPLYWYRAECDLEAAAVAEGRMTYDRASAEACLAAFAPPSCTEPYQGGAPACVAAVAPAVPPGGACMRREECLSNETCASLDGTCPGHCSGVGLGAACDAATGCGPGLWCDTGHCAPRKGGGEACDQTQTLGASGNCAEDLSCTSGFCSYVSAAGESCAALACDPALPLYCDGATSTCQAIPTAGQECGPSGLCAASLYCDSSGTAPTCLPNPTAPQPDGQTCAAPFFCGPSSYCDSTLICRPRKPVGTPCSGADQCLVPAVCDAAAMPNVCAPPRVAGSACTPYGTTPSKPCSNGSWCHVVSGTTGTCATSPSDGQPCGAIGVGDQADCATGYCAFASPGDTVGTCQPVGGPGAPCRGGGECLYSCDTISRRCAGPTCP
jgi:hypothetical protein